jgi:hypothetical protein
LLILCCVLLASASHAASPNKTTIKVFVIAVDDNGERGEKIGCGDSVLPITRKVDASKGHIRAALNALFSIGDQLPDDFYNSLKQSSLSVDRIVLEKGVSKTARVYLKGNLSIGGSCDSPRVEAQLRRTITQFPSVNKAKIFLNGAPLEEAQSH